MKLCREGPLPYTTGKRSQIIYITYTAHTVPDRRVILKGENKHMPMYLGTVVVIFRLLWSGVGDSQGSEDGKDVRPAQLERSATAESTETHQGKERPGE